MNVVLNIHKCHIFEHLTNNVKLVGVKLQNEFGRY